MIKYNRSAFGLNLLFRIHGSAIYRSVIPGLFAVGFYLLIRFQFHDDEPGDELGHPYAIGVVVSGTTFLIVFRASQGYSRYWEAASSTYLMMSKWMDAAMHTSVFHMQCDHYDKIKPPSYYDHPDLNAFNLTRDRERVRGRVRQNSEFLDVRTGKTRKATDADTHASGKRVVQRSINAVDGASLTPKAKRHIKKSTRRIISSMNLGDLEGDDINPTPLLGHGGLDGNWGSLYGDGKATYFDKHDPTVSFADKRGFSSTCGGRTPSLFLQELAHLSSLLTAVALSTLRNDIDDAESPLDLYEPGSPWPEVDPGDDEWLLQGPAKATRAFSYFLGFGRSSEERTRSNACRPLPVLGGVSDNEIRFLQMARGPYAKTQLCWSWLSEFIVRENIAGSLGEVGQPIVSRVIQFLGDGMLGYNHARKIMFIPFPFVHAQLSAAFVLIMIPTIPFLMDQYTDSVWLGVFLSLFAVMCLSGIHEVARELENPFRNVPNDLPVVTLQAEFNEALITMYAGYHPDAFWDAKFFRRRASLGASLSSLDEMDGDGVTMSSADQSNNDSMSQIPLDDVLEKPKSSHEMNKQQLEEEEQIDRLKVIVEQQGKLMEMMMEEQKRLNKLVEAVLFDKK
jgi:predicted membrane chloride channel (bestrophin family)